MTDDVPAKKLGFGKIAGIGCLGLVGIFAGLAVLGAIVGNPEKGAAVPVVASSEPQKVTIVADLPKEPEISLTGPQSNAVRSAEQYISMTGFSRNGLIDQLSSDAGEGYDIADATVAVDSLNIDWNEQAARSAKQYLAMTGFSCKGLIEQLASSAGEKYTKAQATYGAKQAGAC